MTEKDYLLEVVFSEYQKRVEAHFRGTDERIEANEKLRLREAEFIEQALKLHRDSQEKALSIQAVEYERRLTTLNHVHEQALQAQAATVPREMFQTFSKDLETWKYEFNKWRDLVNLDSLKLTGTAEKLSNLDTKFDAYTRTTDAFKAATLTQITIVTTRMFTLGGATGVMLILLQIAMNYWFRK